MRSAWQLSNVDKLLLYVDTACSDVTWHYTILLFTVTILVNAIESSSTAHTYTLDLDFSSTVYTAHTQRHSRELDNKHWNSNQRQQRDSISIATSVTEDSLFPSNTHLICDDCLEYNREAYQYRSMLYCVPLVRIIISTLISAVLTRTRGCSFTCRILCAHFTCFLNRDQFV